MLVTAPGVLELVDDSVSIRATAAQGTTVVAVVGREADVKAWVGTDAFTAVTGLADDATLATEPGQGTEPPVTAPAPTTSPSEPSASPTGDDADGADATDEAETDAPGAGSDDDAGEPADPALSDMWVAQAEGNGSAELSWTHRPGRWVLLVATTGAGAGQPTLELTWPREVVTPWFRPGSWLGGALALVGLALLVLAWNRRRSAEPAWVGVDEEVAATMPAAETATPELPAVPLTRRQLRELEAARGSARPSRPVPTVRRGGETSGAEPAAEPSAPEPAPAQPAATATWMTEPAAGEPAAALPDSGVEIGRASCRERG